MQYLRGWMYGVGALYLVIAFLFSPPMVALALPKLGFVLEPAVERVIADFLFFLGAILGVLGVFLLRGAEQPHLNRELVKLVIWVELIAGALLSLYVALRGYGDPAVHMVLALLHGGVALLGRDALIKFRRHLSPVRYLDKAS